MVCVAQREGGAAGGTRHSAKRVPKWKGAGEGRGQERLAAPRPQDGDAWNGGGVHAYMTDPVGNHRLPEA